MADWLKKIGDGVQGIHKNLLDAGKRVEEHYIKIGDNLHPERVENRGLRKQLNNAQEVLARVLKKNQT